MTAFSFIVLLVLVSVDFQQIRACSPRSSAPKPQNGLPPCLIPPFENLVFQLEGPVEDQPRFRTGCYTKADEVGSPFNANALFPSETAQPLNYYVIDWEGRQRFLSKERSVWLPMMSRNGTSIHQKFEFHNLCFPMGCYSSEMEYVSGCRYPFYEAGSWVAKMAELEDFHGVKKAKLEKPRHLGYVSDHDSWLFCQTGNNQLIPIMTRELPFGHLQHLKRRTRGPKDMTEYGGPEIVQSVTSWGPVPFGCDIVFPLEAPFDTYEQRFWYWGRGRGQMTIVSGQTTITERIKNFTFEDFCFPSECYLVHKPFCTGKMAGNESRNTKEYSVRYKPTPSNHGTVIATNDIQPRVERW